MDVLLSFMAMKFRKSLEQAADKPQKFADFYKDDYSEPYIYWNEDTRHVRSIFCHLLWTFACISTPRYGGVPL